MNTSLSNIPINTDITVFRDEKYYAIERAVKHRIPYLLRGAHGTGKTVMAKHILHEEFVKKYGPESVFYASAATIDPFLNFMGIPEKNTEGTIHFLEMVLPKNFAFGQVRAILFDEYNRGGKAIRNSTMELIQTGCMNGTRFENLESIGAIVNPYDPHYDTEELDLAQADRFIVQVDFPSEPCIQYFTEKYSKYVAIGIYSWWKQLSEEHKLIISNRRIDNALEYYIKYQIPFSDILPKDANLPLLLNSIENGPIHEKLKYMADEDLETFFADENNHSAARDHVMSHDNYIGRYFAYFNTEKMIAEMIRMDREKISRVLSHVVNYHARRESIKHVWPKIGNVVEQIIKSNIKPEFAKDLEDVFEKINKSGAINLPK